MQNRRSNQATVGTQVYNYTLKSPIDSGGMGAVWEVVDSRGVSRVMKFCTENNESLRRQFMFEGSMLRLLSTPPTPDGVKFTRVYDIGVTDAPLNLPFYTMDAVKNRRGKYRSLRDVQFDPFREEEYSIRSIAQWFVDIAKSLAYIHKVGLVHGDVKPANIVIDSTGCAVLVDFGAMNIVAEYEMIRASKIREFGNKLSKLDALIGTYDFMAPELGDVRSEKPRIPTASSDIYSLGATFWQLIFNEKRPDLETEPEAVINDEYHRAVLSDSRFRNILPKMLTPYVKQRISLEECLEIFNERMQFNMKDIISRSSRVLEMCDKSVMFEPKVGMILQTLDEYVKLIPQLRFTEGASVYEGDQVFARLYDKYRKAELRLLKTMLTGGKLEKIKNIENKLQEIDQKFLSDFGSANLLPLAEILFNRLNALWAKLCDKGVYSDADKSLMERCVSVARSYLSPAAQFVFGKYRHIAWELDTHRYFSNMKHSDEYRGERAADRLFMYEKTLASYIPDPDVVNFHLSSLAERNKAEDLLPEEIIDLAQLWKAQ